MTTPLQGRLTCTVPEMAVLLGIGRDSAYAAVERGELPAIRVGRRLIVPVPKLLELIGAHDTNETAPVPTETASTTSNPGQGEGSHRESNPLRAV